MIAKCIPTLIDNNVKDISFTMDIWTCDVSPVSVMSLTVRWLNTDSQPNRTVLQSQELPGSHTCTMIHKTFEDMLQRWNIKKEMVHVVLQDNVRNMEKAMKECGVTSLGYERGCVKSKSCV